MDDPGALWLLTATEARRLIGTRVVSPVELLDACIARIGAENPRLNAIICTDFDRARAAARAAERSVLRGDPLGPLHGLPIAVKHANAVEGLPADQGSRLRAGQVAERDDAVVARLRDAGAIVVGTTNIPEFATGGISTNPLYGPAGNPHDPSRSCGGSSGGGAAALASHMVPLANGSDLGGSLRMPAAWCGIVGMRPTPGRIPDPERDPLWSPLSVEGPMGRTVDDCALLFHAMAGFDPHDPLSWPLHPAPPPQVALGGLRVACTEDLGVAPVSAATQARFAAACNRLADLGPIVSRVADWRLDDGPRVFDVLRATLYQAWFRDLSAAEADLLGPAVRWNVDRGHSLTAADVARAASDLGTIQRRFQAVFETVDLVMTPTMAVPPVGRDGPPPAEIDGRPMKTFYDWFALTYLITLTGCPAISIPAGRLEGMPFGVQLVAAPRRDQWLLAAARTLEPLLADPAPG